MALFCVFSSFLLYFNQYWELVLSYRLLIYIFIFCYNLLKIFLTILSSNEWKVIIANLPFWFKTLTTSSIVLLSLVSSSLTSILIAWKVLPQKVFWNKRNFVLWSNSYCKSVLFLAHCYYIYEIHHIFACIISIINPKRDLIITCKRIKWIERIEICLRFC